MHLLHILENGSTKYILVLNYVKIRFCKVVDFKIAGNSIVEVEGN